MTEKDNKKVTQFLDKLISEVRRIVNDEKMINKCDTCQGLIGRYLESIKIPFYPCSTNNVVSSDVAGHSFIVTLIEGKYYLVDPAFIQFMYDKTEDLVIKGIRCLAKSPYYYMNIIDENLTKELISNGYFELNEKTAYTYGNAFYFTKTNIPSNLVLKAIGGEAFMNAFTKGNDRLRNYNIGEIELDEDIHISK